MCKERGIVCMNGSEGDFALQIKLSASSNMHWLSIVLTVCREHSKITSLTHRIECMVCYRSCVYFDVLLSFD